MEDWAYVSCQFSTKPFKGSGYGDMLLKVVLYGDRLWIVNMATNGGAGVQIKLENLMGLVCGSLYGLAGILL